MWALAPEAEQAGACKLSWVKFVLFIFQYYKTINIDVFKFQNNFYNHLDL